MFVRSAVLLSSLLAFGCSSSAPAPTGQGTAAGTGVTGEIEKNSYGAAYPTKNLGIAARNGTIAGNIIRNYKFRGYKTIPGTTITPGTLEQISLADFFDPELRNKSPSGEPYRVLHISVSSVWCNPCNIETADIVKTLPELDKKGVLFFTALADGPAVGTGATAADLDGWIKKHKANYAHALDPALKNFGGFFDAAAVPFNADIDLRSMEILYGEVGGLDVTPHVTKWVNWTKSNPPQAIE